MNLRVSPLILAVVALFACTSAVTPVWSAASCPTACSPGSCPQPGNGCYGNACFCRSGTCHGMQLGCGGGPRDPFEPVGLTTPVMSLSATGATFDSSDGVLEAIRWASGWTINVDSGVDAFTVTGSWTDQSWSAILSDIVYDQGLNMTVNTTTHTVTIYE